MELPHSVSEALAREHAELYTFAAELGEVGQRVGGYGAQFLKLSADAKAKEALGWPTVGEADLLESIARDLRVILAAETRARVLGYLEGVLQRGVSIFGTLGLAALRKVLV